MYLIISYLHGWNFDGGMGWGMMHWDGIFWVGIMLMLIFWIAVIVAMVFFIRWLIVSTRNRGQSGPHQTQGRSALDILKERYAHGEIDKQEFEEKKRDLLS